MSTNEEMTALHYRIVSRFDELEDIGKQWELAYNNSPLEQKVLCSSGWVYGLWFQYRIWGLKVFTIWKGDALVFAFPFIKKKTRLDGVLIQGVSEILPFFVFDEDRNIFSFFLSILQKQYPHYRIKLTRIDHTLPQTKHFLEVAIQLAAKLKLIREDNNIIIDLSEGYESYKAQLSKHTKEALRKSKSRLNIPDQQIRFSTYRSLEEMHHSFDKVLYVDSQSWKNLRGGAIQDSWYEGPDLKWALQKLAEQGFSRVFVMEIDSKPVAFIMAMVDGATAYFSMWSFSDHASYFMPGKQLMDHAIQQLAQEGVQYIDLWGREDRFKKSWSKLGVPRQTLELRFGKPSMMLYAGKMIKGIVNVFHPLKVLVTGSDERYRLKHDQPSLFEKAIRNPVKGMLNLLSINSTHTKIRVSQKNREKDVNIGITKMTPIQQRHFPGTIAGESGQSVVFEMGQAVLGAIFFRYIRGKSAILVEELIFIGQPSQALKTKCLRSFLHAYAPISIIYEQPHRQQERGYESVSQIING